jgi:hypothetical protein
MNADKPDAISPDGNLANFMMVLVAAPVVMAWVGLPVFLVTMAFRHPEIVDDIESYKSVLLIIGSPALVIIYKVLELWTAQQNSQIEQTRKGTFRNGHDHNENEDELLGKLKKVQ